MTDDHPPDLMNTETPHARPPRTAAGHDRAAGGRPCIPTGYADRLLGWADRHRWWCFAAIGLLYALGFNGQWRLDSDTSLYAALGRNLAQGAGYTYQGQPHTMAYPGLPYGLALIWRLCGPDQWLAAHLAVWLLGVTALGLVYRLLTLHAGRPAAVVVVCLTAVAENFYRYAFEILTDMLFMVGVLAALAGYEALRRADSSNPHPHPAPPRGAGWAWVGDAVLMTAGLGIAVATRPTMWVLVGAVGLAVAWALIVKDQPRVHLALAGTAVAVLGLFAWLDPRQGATVPDDWQRGGEQSYEAWARLQLHHPVDRVLTILTDNIPRFFEPHLAEAVFGIELGPGLNTLAGLVILALGVWLLRARTLWGCWFGLTVFTMLAVDPVVRYVLPLIPFIAWGVVAFDRVHRTQAPLTAQPQGRGRPAGAVDRSQPGACGQFHPRAARHAVP